ncbi:MAG TPA: response regulator [Caulobacteraceae bacterium]|nr:response regulator [Caulobacteraceae bacterium]
MPLPATRASVLIVEDDASLLGALVFALRADHYEVHGHRTANRALADLRSCDCLVIDLKLPDMDGLTLIDQLRELGVQAPAILITTNPDERSRRRAARAGVTIVEKPLMGGTLGAHVATAIGRPQTN